MADDFTKAWKELVISLVGRDGYDDDVEWWKEKGAEFRSSSKRVDKLKAVDDALADVAESLGLGRQFGLSEFFKNVGDSLVQTQRELDEKSKLYSDEVANSDYAVPAMFRVPKVNAEIKFALEKSTATGFNLLFVKDQTKAKESHLQSIQFEIAAVPPPPEFADRESRLTPHLDFLVDPIERKEVRQHLLSTNKLPETSPFRDKANWDKVLILNYPQTKTTKSAASKTIYWLLITDNTKLHTIWSLTVKKTKTKTTATADLVIDDNDPALIKKNLKKLLKPLEEKQKDVLPT